MDSFAASVRDWAERTKEAQDQILRDSVADVLADAQLPKAQGGRMPVDTGNLRNSIASDLNGSGLFTEDQGGGFELTITEMKGGDVAHFAWTAAYAMRMEYGFVGTDSLGRSYEQGGNHFAGGAAERWLEYVAKNAEANKV